MEEQTLLLPPEIEQAFLHDLQQSTRLEHQVLHDPTQRRAVLEALGAPVVFAYSEEPITTDILMNYWLWCYFEQGSAWQTYLAMSREDNSTLATILEGYEFNAFGFQGQRHLSLLPTERYVAQAIFVIEMPEWTRRIELRIPKGFKNILTHQTLDVFAQEIAQFKTELGDWFEGVKEKIGAWLSDTYEKINPTRQGFVSWFLAHHGGLGQTIAFVPITVDYSIYDVTFTKKEVEDQFEGLIHAYCEFRRAQQHEHQQALGANAGKSFQPTSLSPLGGDSSSSGNNIETIHGLFQSESHRQRAFEALTLVDPSLINDKDKWIGPKRGGMSALIAWVEVLERRDYMRKVADRTRLSLLLNQTFDGLRMNTDNDSLKSPIRTPNTTPSFKPCFDKKRTSPYSGRIKRITRITTRFFCDHTSTVTPVWNRTTSLSPPPWN